MKLYLKHLAATSGVAGFADIVADSVSALRLLRSPELGLIHAEHRMMDQCLKDLIEPDFNCIDIGAHIGSKTRQLVDLAPQGRHFAVEASPRKSRWLQKRFPAVTVFNNALSDASGEVRFYENMRRPGFSSLLAPQEKHRGNFREVTVKAATLDALIPEDVSIDFIKIDIEGHEYQAFRGAARVLRQSRPIILFEAGSVKGGKASGARSDDLFRLLHDDYGYDIFPVFHVAHKRGPIDLKQFHDYRVYPFLSFNFFALRREAE